MWLLRITQQWIGFNNTNNNKLRIMKEERKYIAALINKIVKSGANVLLV
jgi:hypothetical protein